jgi:hypothetical protein
MKRKVAILLALIMAVFALAACGSGGSEEDSGTSEPVSVDSLETIGDIIALDSPELQSAVYEDKVVYAFKLDDTYYRAIADIDKKDSEKYINIDITNEGYEKKQNAIVAPLKIDKIENLNETILSQEELDALKGKTGQELQDEGWTFNGYDLYDMVFWMNYGAFQYNVKFDGQVPESEWETYVAETGTKDLKVVSAEFSCLGDATNIE